jgi:hypothetical protein
MFDNLDRYCFYPVLEFVVSEFLSNKALLLPDLYKKIEDLVDNKALIKSLKEPEDKIDDRVPATVGFRTVRFFGALLW